MDYRLEDPKITRACKYGYPYNTVEPELCEGCGEEPIDEEYWEVGGIKLCRDCMMDYMKNLIEDDLEFYAKAAGYERSYGDAV